MSERSHATLTREELEAFLAEAQASRPDEREDVFAAKPEQPSSRGPLMRAFDEFGDELGRQLSTQYQRSVRLRMSGPRLVTLNEMVGATIPQDEVLSISLSPDGARGAILIGRSLFFAWLSMALGGSANLEPEVPNRANSAIEQRFLRLMATELLHQLARSLSRMRDVKIEAGDLLEPTDLLGRMAERLCEVSYDVTGLGEVARLRVFVPTAWVERVESADAPSAKGDAAATLERRVRDVPFTVRAEIGRAEVPLRTLAELAEGDTLPLDPVAGGRILVRLEDTARFVAVPGSVGTRLAIRLVEEV